MYDLEEIAESLDQGILPALADFHHYKIFSLRSLVQANISIQVSDILCKKYASSIIGKTCLYYSGETCRCCSKVVFYYIFCCCSIGVNCWDYCKDCPNICEDCRDCCEDCRDDCRQGSNNYCDLDRD